MDPEDLLDDSLLAYEQLTAVAAARPAAAPTLDRLGACARDVASARLLARGDLTGFRAMLEASGRHRLALLELPVPLTGSAWRRYFAKSRCAGLIDALVAADDGLARAIITATPRAWLEGLEYEEDALHVELLEMLCQHDPRDLDRPVGRRRDAIAARLEALEARGPSARTALLLALHAVDASDVRAAFDRWLDERAAARASRPDAPTRAPWLTFVDDAVFFEGLALDRLARGLGFTPLGDEAGMPRMLTRRLPPWSFV